MRYSLLPLLLAITLLCLGCVDYTEDTTVRADGSATVEVGISAKDVMGDITGGASSGAVESEKVYEDGSGKTWTEHKDGLVVRHIEGQIKDFRKGGTLAPEHTGLSKFNPQWYTVTALGFGRYRLQRTISVPGAGAAHDAAADSTDGEGNQLTQLGGSFMRSLQTNMLAGHNFSVTIHAPLILSSNADTKDGMTGVTWKRPLSELVGDAGKPLTIDVTVWLINYYLVGGIGGGVLLLLLIGGVVAARRHSKGGRGSGMPTSA